VGRKNHNPSIARKIIRNLKRGQSPESLFPLTQNITDPYYHSISFFNLASFNSNDIEQSQSWFNLGLKDFDKVHQSWRRVELLGELSKILKRVENGSLKNSQYALLLSYSMREKNQDTKDFFVKNSKNFPTSMLKEMLKKAVRLKEHEFVVSKAILRSLINRDETRKLVNQVLELESKTKIKLLGYIHLQFNKLKIEISPTALELALTIKDLDEYLNYLVRVCSTTQDLDALSELDLAPDILLAIAVRADRKGWPDFYHKYLLKAKSSIDSLAPSDTKDRLLFKYEKSKIGLIPQISKPINVQSFDFPLVEKGKHTLGLFNTYEGNWNHPHFKAVYKASKLCSAFDLDLALIAFPKISPEKLMKEVNKEMRVTKDDFLAALFSLKRVMLFENDIEESLVGQKVVTTSNPDKDKTDLPSGKLCMVMGLGPKGLPKSYLKKSNYHFELTGSNVAFETGTAMGAISSELGSRIDAS